MPSFAWTPETTAQLETLRASGISMLKCSLQLGCSEAAIFKALHPKPQAPPKPKPVPQKPPIVRSCPIHRHFDAAFYSNTPQPTKSEIYAMLEVAVRNTMRMSA